MKSCSVLVSSCDAYEDVWGAFFTLFFRYWPDCPFPVYLISERLTYSDERVYPILVGEDKGWASNLRLALEKVPTSYVLYMQEDYFFDQAVDAQSVLGILEHMKSQLIGHVRLMPWPEPDLPYPDYPKMGLISSKNPFRVSLQAGFWDKELLHQLTVDGENGWDMESKGTQRSRDFTVPFLCVNEPALPYPFTAVYRGRWLPEAVDLCIREGITLNTNLRPVENLQQRFWRERNPFAKVLRHLAYLFTGSYWNKTGHFRRQ